MSSFLLCFLKNSFAAHRILDWQSFPFLAFWQYDPTAFWFPWFRIRNQLLIVLKSLCICGMTFLFWLSEFYLCSWLLIHWVWCAYVWISLFILLWACWASWIYKLIYINLLSSDFESSSAIISSHILSASFFLSFLLAVLLCVFLMVSHSSLRLHSFFVIPYSLWFSDKIISIDLMLS